MPLHSVVVSILVVQLVPEGLLFGADRNITRRLRRGPDVLASGQSQRPKVLRWPNRQVVIGYVGRASVAGQPADAWLYDFIGRNLDTNLSLRQLADNLKSDLECDLGAELSTKEMILHLGGFVEDAGQQKPEVWYVRNARGLDELGYTDIVDEFDVSDEIPKYFSGMTGDQIRANVEQRAKNWEPFWFHQGYDLATFNMLDQVLRAGMRPIIQNHPDHQFPDSLQEWSKHLKMAILTYGAYFEAFYPPFKQQVGGGADVVWAKWPRGANRV